MSAENAKPGDKVRINAHWRAHRRMLPDKVAAWGDPYPATGDEGVVSANSPGERLWVHFAGDSGTLPVHYDECEMSSETKEYPVLYDWYDSLLIWLNFRREPMLKHYVLLVNDDLLLSQLQANAANALSNGRIVKVLDDPSGLPNASLVQVALTPEDYNTILEADKFANSHNAVPEISVTEYPAEPQ